MSHRDVPIVAADVSLNGVALHPRLWNRSPQVLSNLWTLRHARSLGFRGDSDGLGFQRPWLTLRCDALVASMAIELSAAVTRCLTQAANGLSPATVVSVAVGAFFVADGFFLVEQFEPVSGRWS